MAANDIAHLQAVLARVFEFSPADIAANRMGVMSEAQKARITNKHYAHCRVAWELFALLFGSGLLGFSAEMIRTESMGVQSMLTYVGVTFVWGVIVWAFILYYRHQLQRTLRQGRVTPVVGQIRLFTERGARMQSAFFFVGRHKFKMDDSTHFAALQNSGIAGREAVMYISSPWRSLLSVVLQA